MNCVNEFPSSQLERPNSQVGRKRGNKTVSRQLCINWMRANVPPDRWEQVWWLAPTISLLLLPVGAAILQVLGRFGWYGATRATQGLMLLSVVGGLVVGSVVLWSVREANLEPHALNRAQWLARFAVLGPFFTLLILFWIARVT